MGGGSRLRLRGHTAGPKFFICRVYGYEAQLQGVCRITQAKIVQRPPRPPHTFQVDSHLQHPEECIAVNILEDAANSSDGSQ